MTDKKPDDDVQDYFNENYEDVLDYLKDLTPNSRKTKLASLVVFCNNDDAKDAYRKVMNKDSDEVRSESKNQKMSESQKANWVDQDELHSIYNDLEKQVKPLFAKKNLTMLDLQFIQQFIILSLYVNSPPRRLLDYTALKIKNINKENDNYIDKNNFVFNQYKTVKTYGTQNVAIPKKLKLLLNKWMKINNTEYLLFDRNENQLQVAQLKQRLNKIFGKNVSVGILRHSYLSDKYKDIPKLLDLEETAKNMGHSVNEALEYIKK